MPQPLLKCLCKKLKNVETLPPSSPNLLVKTPLPKIHTKHLHYWFGWYNSSPTLGEKRNSKWPSTWKARMKVCWGYSLPSVWLTTSHLWQCHTRSRWRWTDVTPCLLLEINVCVKCQIGGKEEGGNISLFMFLLTKVWIFPNCCQWLSHHISLYCRYLRFSMILSAYLTLALKVGFLKSLPLAFSVI